jgi:hypothetical protein
MAYTLKDDDDDDDDDMSCRKLVYGPNLRTFGKHISYRQTINETGVDGRLILKCIISIHLAQARIQW